MKTLRIVIAEPSAIIRSGILAVVKRFHSMDIQPFDTDNVSKLESLLAQHSPDIAIVNPALLGIFSLQELKKRPEARSVRFVALQSSLSDSLLLKEYDETISVYDSPELIKSKLTTLAGAEREVGNDSRGSLSTREKEIVGCVVKGMTNKQIADKLFLSAHTVITHRRNIASKLQIHSPAGLTIYAIVNKLVELDDIKDSISNQNP